MEEWEVGKVKEDAEHQFNEVGKPDSVCRRRSRELRLLFVSFGLLSFSVLLLMTCDYLLEGANPEAPRLEETMLEGSELIIGLIGVCSSIASRLFGVLVLVLIGRFILSHKKSLSDTSCKR
ncbi:MAG: hypothetical protein AAGI48_06945 [Verrucomicrobiota bacterium]